MLPSFIDTHITLPIVVAPMFLITSPEMVIQACTAGVMAAYPLTNARDISSCDKTLHQITACLRAQKKACPHQKTAPWIANMIVHSSYQRFEEELALIKKYQPPVVITALGSPKRIIAAVHAYGGVVWADVNSIAFAKKAAAAGADGLILLCAGAGGHTGHLSPFAFAAAVRSFFKGTLLMSGAIMDAPAIRAIQALGIDLAYMGSAFLACTESLASVAYKKALCQATADDITTTDSITGVPANFLKSSLERLGDTSRLEKADLSDRYNNSSVLKPWKDIWSAGHGVGSISAIEPIQHILARLKKDLSASESY